MMAKLKPGRHPFEPTKEQRDMVKIMAGHGIPQDTIVLALSVDLKTLRKHFRKELNQSAAMVEATLASSQFARAKGSDSVAQRATEFILNTRFGWKKQETHEFTGKDGGPIETMEITDERRAKALANFIARTKSGG